MGTVIFGSQMQVNPSAAESLGLPLLTKLGIESTQAADGFIYIDQIIGIAATNLDYGSLSVPGRYRLQNADPNNAVEIGKDVGGFELLERLLPGEDCSGRIGPGVQLQAKFDAAPGKLEGAIAEA